jgi:hypothetical protein
LRYIIEWNHGGGRTMKRLVSFIFTIIIVVGILLICSSCSTSEHEGFAIYLTKENIPPSEMKTLSQVDIAEQPVISLQDVITYNAQSHELKLTPAAYERIYQLNIPVEGKSFLVCVDKKIIYWGAFWTPVSSIPFGGVTIWKPYDIRESTIVTLEPGYPSSTFYGGEDPRNSPEILKSLKQAGKLVDKLTLATVDKLPSSMKGYELYSWEQESQWHFTLITGTNRNKTLEEIVSEDDFISEAGWVNIHTVGIESIEAVLGKVPRGEFVIWLDGMRGLIGQADINIQLPPEQTVNIIKDYAGQCSLDFLVQT